MGTAVMLSGVKTDDGIDSQLVHRFIYLTIECFDLDVDAVLLGFGCGGGMFGVCELQITRVGKPRIPKRECRNLGEG
jgi:hypothetical protein